MRVFSTETDKPIENVSMSGNWFAASTWTYKNQTEPVFVWSLSTQETPQQVRTFEPSSKTIIDPFGRLIYCPDGSLEIRDLETEKLDIVPKRIIGVRAVVFSPNGENLVVASGLNQYSGFDVFRLLSDRTFEVCWAFPYEEYVYYINPTISPDGKMIIYGSGSIFRERDKEQSADFFVHLTENKEPLTKLTIPHAARIMNLCLSNQGYLFCLTKKNIRVWDISTAKEISLIKAQSRRNFISFVLHPSNRWLVTSDESGLIRYWDTTTFLEKESFDWGEGIIQTLAFSPDGLMGAAGTRTGRVVVWDVDL